MQVLLDERRSHTRWTELVSSLVWSRKRITVEKKYI